MSFNEYRNRRKDLKIQELDIERFVFDVFAYTLPMFGFPILKVPTTTRKENNYVEDDFIINIGLSVLPIALFKRDDWKIIFEKGLEAFGFTNILQVEYFLEKTLIDCCEDEDEVEDTLSKILFSLALYSEVILFFNYKGVETYFDALPKSCSQLCSKLIGESDDLDEPLSSALAMHPDITEPWIEKFIREVAIPYGSSEVSNSFSAYSLDEESDDAFADNAIKEESVVQKFDASNERSKPSLPEDSASGSHFEPSTLIRQSCAGEAESSEEGTILKAKSLKRRKKVLANVLHRCLNERKRSRSMILDTGDFEDAFRKVSLEKENISPEKQNIKRQRKMSDNDKLEL